MKIREKILVIEDEQTIRNFMQAVLTANDYDVLLARTGAMGESMIASHCPDVIILDLGLPDVDGMEILRKVRRWSKVPILVVSARTHERDKVEALDAGADDFNAEDEMYEIITSPENFSAVRSALEAAGYVFETAEITRVAENYVSLTDENDIKFMNLLLDALDDNDDVQNVAHNWDE